MKKIQKNKARCRKCGDTIESLYRHDFKWCSCKAIFIDGGLDYLRRGGDFVTLEELSEWGPEEESDESTRSIPTS